MPAATVPQCLLTGHFPENCKAFIHLCSEARIGLATAGVLAAVQDPLEGTTHCLQSAGITPHKQDLSFRPGA